MADNERPAFPAPAAQIPAAEIPGINSLLTLAVGVVVVGGLYFGRDVLVPVTLAGLLSFVLAPLVNLLRRIKLGRVPSVLLAVLCALGVIVAVAGVIGMQMASLTADLPKYEQAVRGKIQALKGVGAVITSLEKQFDESTGRVIAPPTREAQPAPRGTAQSPMTVTVEQSAPSLLGIARSIVGPLLAPFATTAMVLIVAIFILLQQEDLRDRMIRLFGTGDLHRTTLAMNDAAHRLSRYFLLQLAINTGFGLVIGTGLSLLHVPSPILWGLLAGLLRFVPYVGIYIAAALPIVLAAVVEPGWGLAAWTLALFVVGELIVGQAIEPFAYGQSTGLSPVSVVVAAIFWTWVWGTIGLLLATPLTLCLVVLGRHVKRMEFLDVMLGDRPPLTPVESLYQRMLANDPEEAASQAEALLRERALSAYYDDVVLKALLLATRDASRGVLGRDQQLVIRDAICGLVEDLDDFADEAPEADGARPLRVQTVAPALEDLPPAWRGARAVLCLGGRTPLDDAAAAMLAQLVRKHGLGAEMERHEAVSRSAIGGLSAAGVGSIVVSYFGETGSVGHLRFLLRRLRQRAPGVPLLVALWQEDASAHWETGAADQRVDTLHDALAFCLDSAERSARPAEPVETAA